MLLKENYLSMVNRIINPNFTRAKVRRYGLGSQRFVSYLNSEKLLNQNGFVLNDKNKNCLFLHNSEETMKHFLVKAMILKILRERGRIVGSEIEVRNGIADLVDLDNSIIYEVETNITKEKVYDKIKNYNSAKDIFFIDTREVPDDLNDAEKYLREKVV